MKLIDHGLWVRYVPTKFPEFAPPNAMYARREGDKADWYEYVKEENSHFKKGTIKFTTMRHDGKIIIMAAAPEADMLFPAGCHVYEFPETYRGFDHRADYYSKLIDSETGKVSDLPPPPPSPITETESKILSALDKITERLDKLENK